MYRILLLLLLQGGAAWAQSSGSVSHHMAQARLFSKKGWYGDARKELEAAIAAPGGAENPEAHLLLAQVCFEVMEVECSVEHARLSAGLATVGSDVAQQSSELLSWLTSNFGTLEIQAPQAGITTRLQVEMTSTVYDPDLKKYTNKMALRLKDKTRLPVRVSLPVGAWKVNGVQAEVRPEATTTVELPMRALGNKGLANLQVTRLEISTGFGVFFGNRTVNLHPSLETQVSLTQPIGPAFAALTLDRAFRGYDAEGDSVRSPTGGSVGLRLGREVYISGPFSLRPSLGYRYGLIPGIALDCTQGTDSLECGVPGATDWTDASVYAVARAHMPYAELSMDYREGGRTNAFGIGLRFAVDGVFAHLPQDSQAAWQDEGGQISVHAPDSAFTSTGLRVLSNFSLAF